jgi:tetratricopeptide (TPR) repeat protein
MTTARINSGRPQAAIRAAQEAQGISREIGYPWGQASSAKGMAEGLLEMGAYSEALASAEQAVDIARQAGILVLLTASLIVLGAVQRAMLNLTAARAAHLEAMALITPMGLPPLIEMMAAELCADCALAGAWEEALAYAQQVLSMRSGTFVFSTKLTLWCETEALVRASESERAAEDVRSFGERVGSSRRYRIPYLRALAVLAESRDEIALATQHLQEAAKLAEEIGLPGELWPIQVALGELYLTGGDEEQAQRAFKQVATLVRKLVDSIGDSKMKDNFLVSPLIQRALEQRSFNR